MMRGLNSKTVWRAIAVGVSSLWAVSCATPSTDAPSILASQLEARVQAAVDVEKIAPGFAIVVLGPSEAESYAAAAGVADPEGRAFTVDTPLRIASNTKTFTAATILRLWEQGLIDLDAPIAGLIDPAFDALLRTDGYDTDSITVRHLLMHTAGMPDHADDAYVEIIMQDPSRHWTRAEQVALLVESHDPLGPPNSQFVYSDTGYILLGDIIERVTGETLAASVRRLLKFSELELGSTWWEQVEERPAQSPKRARQYLAALDATDWNGSVDLYGGGGLIMSPHDLARFMAALMRGEIFDDPATLETMRNAPGHPFPQNYRIGLFPRTIGGVDGYSHEGFWGTHVIYFPELDVALSAMVLDQAGYGKMFTSVTQTIEDIVNAR